MSDDGGLINLGGLAKPATVLVEKISDAVGTLYRPRQIRRVAAAEADAAKIHALAQLEISEMQARGLVRLIEEQGKKQENIERITARAIEELRPDAKPEDLQRDWLANFFDKCKLISDEDMQSLWARVLAGEANSPGTYSKRTVELMYSLDKADAELFTSLAGSGGKWETSCP